MKKIIINIRILAPFLFFTFYGCKKPSSFYLEASCPDIYTINENIVPIPNTDNCYSSIWVNDSTIIGSYQKIKVNNNIDIISSDRINWLYQIISKNHTHQKLLCIYRNEFTEEYSILEYNIAENTTDIIFSAKNYITDALYFRDNNQIVFSIINEGKIELFLYDKASREKEPLFSYPWNWGIPDEQFSLGIDIHPKENILLIPLIGEFISPKLLKYQIDTKKIDTLDIHFEIKDKGEYLWVRYSPTGEDVLFCHYSDIVYGESEIGIINMNTLKKTVLDVNTGKKKKSLNLYPSWSPNGKHMVFSSANYLYCDNGKGDPGYPYPELFVRKNVH